MLQDTKEQILQTAFALFITKSYKAVTMKELEKATGLSKGAFYHYFKNKDEIFIEVVKEYFLPSRNKELQETINNYSLLDMIQYSITIFKGILDNIKKFSGIEVLNPNFALLIYEAIKYNPNFEEEINSYIAEQHQIWVTVLERAKDKKEIKSEIDSETMAYIFMNIPLSGLTTYLHKDTEDQSLNIFAKKYQQIYDLAKFS